MRARKPIPHEDVVESMIFYCDRYNENGVIMFTVEKSEYSDMRNFYLDGIRYMTQLRSKIPYKNQYKLQEDYLQALYSKYIEFQKYVYDRYDDEDMLVKRIPLFIEANKADDDKTQHLVKDMLTIFVVFMGLYQMFTSVKHIESFYINESEALLDDGDNVIFGDFEEIIKEMIFSKPPHEKREQEMRDERFNNVVKMLKTYKEFFAPIYNLYI